MARIVPAKPIEGPPAARAALLALEAGLDDTFVVIQRGGAPGTFLVLHPDLGACPVFAVSGERRRDPDTEDWEGDWSALRAAAAATAGKLGLVPGGTSCVFMADTPPPADGRRDDPVFRGQEGRLADAVTRIMEGMVGPKPGDAGVAAAIQADSPGAAPYMRGVLTEAQARWRDGGRDGAPASVAADAPPLADVSAGAADGRELEANDPIVLLLRQAAETVAEGRPIMVQGIEIDAQELTEPDFLLPALLVAAAQDWVPVVLRKEGKGGFHMRLRTDRDAILGYRLAALEPSAPLLLLLPVVDRLRRSARTRQDGKPELSMDEILASFGRWLDAHGLDAGMMDEIDMRIALQVN